jgi:hypothetical protein
MADDRTTSGRSVQRSQNAEDPPRWPGSGWVDTGEIVRYGSSRWLCLQRTCGKPRDASPFWRRLDVKEPLHR